MHLFEKLDNHIPLCEQHHNYISAKFDAKAVKGAVPLEKLRWLSSQRVPTEEWSPKKVKVLPAYKE